MTRTFYECTYLIDSDSMPKLVYGYGPLWPIVIIKTLVSTAGRSR